MINQKVFKQFKYVLNRMTMGMGLGMSCTNIMQQKITQRMSLEQLLEQKLEQQIKLGIKQEQHLEKEELIKKFIKWANKNNSWVNYNKDGFKFKYGTLPYKIAKPMADHAGPGFVHCHYNIFEGKAKGDWTIFVVPDLFPEDFKGCEDFVAIHERGEEISLANHYFASKLEFALASKRKKTTAYSNFINKNYPSKFVDLTQKVHFPILPNELLKFLKKQGKRNTQELDTAEKLIEKYPLPTTILSLMKKYENATKKIEQILNQELGILQNTISKTIKQTQKIGTYPSCEKLAYILDIEFRKKLLHITEEDLHGVSSERINQTMKNLRENIKDYFRKTVSVRSISKNISFPYDFYKAREEVLRNKRIIEIIPEKSHIKRNQEDKENHNS
jgi:hypothetical protein